MKEIVDLKKRLLYLGFTEPILLMERRFRPSLFEKTEHGKEFLLIPRKQATILAGNIDRSQTKSATLIRPYVRTEVPVRLFDDRHFAVEIGFTKMAVQHKLVRGKPFQIWCSVKKNADIALGIIPITDSNVVRELPEEIVDRIEVFGGTKILFVMEKTLVKRDLQSSTLNQIEFYLPQSKIKLEFLSDTEYHDLVGFYDDGFEALLIGPSIHPDDVEEFNIKLTKSVWEPFTFEGARWKDFVEKYGLAEGKKVKIWSFRRTTTHSQIGTGSSQIGFELALVNEEQVQISSLAREIPEEIQDRIKVFGGTKIVFVMEKTLLELDVQSSTTSDIKFSMPQRSIRHPFLTAIEHRYLERLCYYKRVDAFLIGPSIHPDDVVEFNIKLMKCGLESYNFQGARWKDFVEKYGLAEGKKVQIWSFRRTTTHSQIGTGSPQIGFELALVNEEQVQGSSSARQIPEEVEDRIKVFGGSKIVFVMEKTLLKLDVRSSRTSRIKFSMPLGQIKNRFLSDTEDRDLVRFPYHKRVDTFLIGPSIHPDDVQEFNVKLAKRGWESYTFEGARWKNFVEKYGLAEGKKVQIWSFRRTKANTDSQTGTRPPEIGFCIIRS